MRRGVEFDLGDLIFFGVYGHRKAEEQRRGIILRGYV